MESKPKWFKTKGYIHLTPNLSNSNWQQILKKIEDKEFIKQYSFFPLVHRVLKERKYKKIDYSKHIPIKSKEEKNTKEGILHIYRSHKHLNKKNNKIEPSAKLREIFYASHFDAIIYSYYSNLINDLYCKELSKNEELDKSIIAYRKIPIDKNNIESEGKSTIHFSKEVFDEIKKQSENHEEVAVLAFDITNFFPTMDHSILEKAWIDLVGYDDYIKHHYKIFKACTDYRYVNYYDLKKIDNKRCKGFNEARLYEIRKKNGIKCIFGNYKEFRSAIKNKELKVYNPNYKRKTNIIGIPQGLPISATLANLYLLEFDKTIIKELVLKEGMFYRRYSDDIIIVCAFDKISIAENKVSTLIENVKLEISKHKTERFKYRLASFNKKNEKRLQCFLLNKENKEIKPSKLIYLGFEFSGYQTLIKSTNLAKYYRRLIKTIDRRAKRLSVTLQKEPTTPKAIFYNQVKKIINKPIKEESEKSDRKPHPKMLLKKDILTGNFVQIIKLPKNDENSKDIKKSSYMGYVKRCVKIHRSSNFIHQLRKRKHIINTAIKRKIRKYLDR